VGRIVLATPVAPREAIERCRVLVDDVVCLQQPEMFGAVGYWYQEFAATSDSEVVRLLRLQRGAAPSQAEPPIGRTVVEQDVTIPIEGPLTLPAELVLPEHPRALVVFAHGAGSNRLSPRNQFVADRLAPLGFASLRLDLLSADETLEHEKGFAFPLLASRVRAAIDWVTHEPALHDLPIIVYGASTGAAVALLVAASDRRVRAVVSRGGRGDLVANVLDQIHVPCLFLIGSRDDVVRELSEPVIQRLGPRASLRVIPGAGHLFEEPDALAAVCDQTATFLEVVLASPGLGSQNIQVSPGS
jgi:dienelactone hydrolase